jgi:SAM-dependent methyltransferase
MDSLGSYVCRICGLKCSFIQAERRLGLIYTVVKCSSCGTIQTAEHYGSVSPDFVGLNSDGLTLGHIQMVRNHKRHAYLQFLRLLKDVGVVVDFSTSVVDVGCGTGGFLEFLRPIAPKAVGFDASIGQVDYCNEIGLDVERAVCGAEFLELRPELGKSADIVTVWDVFEHIRAPSEFLGELKCLLKTDGILYLSVPNAGAHSWKRHLHERFGRGYSFDPWEHVFYYSPSSLRAVLNASGFECVHVGAVSCYRRPMSFSECIRRISFAVLSRSVSWCPQLYAIARVART